MTYHRDRGTCLQYVARMFGLSDPELLHTKNRSQTEIWKSAPRYFCLNHNHRSERCCVPVKLPGFQSYMYIYLIEEYRERGLKFKNHNWKEGIFRRWLHHADLSAMKTSAENVILGLEDILTLNPSKGNFVLNCRLRRNLQQQHMLWGKF